VKHETIQNHRVTRPDGPEPHLVLPAVEPTTGAVALLLHGGREVATAAVRPWQGAVLRMRPFAGAIRRTADDASTATVAVASLRYRRRGWNGTGDDALADVAWALDALRAEVGRPVVLVGHSMGGRVALRSAGDPSVVGVVGLAPWLPRHEPFVQLADRDVVLLHGARDRTTNPFGTSAFAERAASFARAVVSLRLDGTGHTMVARAHVWHTLTARFVAAIAAGRSIDDVDAELDGVHSTRVGLR
jgi:dienelactone hydrolase